MGGLGGGVRTMMMNQIQIQQSHPLTHFMYILSSIFILKQNTNPLRNHWFELQSCFHYTIYFLVETNVCIFEKILIRQPCIDDDAYRYWEFDDPVVSFVVTGSDKCCPIILILYSKSKHKNYFIYQTIDTGISWITIKIL